MFTEYNEYIKSLEIANKSPHTIRTYKRDLSKIFEFFNIGNIDGIKNLTQNNFREFISSQTELKESSINSILRSASAFFRWLEGNDFLPENYSFFRLRFGKTKFIKEPKKIKAILTPEEIDKMISVAKNKQIKFMIALMTWTAIRRDEVCNIKMSDITILEELDACAIVINGKGSKQRNVYMDKELCEMFHEYLEERTADNCQSEYLFYSNHSSGKLTGTSINNRVLTCLKDAGIEKKITAHRLRGTAITRIIKTHDIFTAMKVAGHSSLNTTRIYDESGNDLAMKALLSRNNKE